MIWNKTYTWLHTMPYTFLLLLWSFEVRYICYDIKFSLDIRCISVSGSWCFMPIMLPFETVIMGQVWINKKFSFFLTSGTTSQWRYLDARELSNTCHILISGYFVQLNSIKKTKWNLRLKFNWMEIISMAIEWYIFCKHIYQNGDQNHFLSLTLEGKY